MKRKLRMGMVGGGRGSFIGPVHRMAARLDGRSELIAGAFSSDPTKAKASGEDLFLAPDRVYTSYQEMAAAEAARPEGDRIDFVSIVVRNDLHFAVAKTFLEAGIHVICDKPMTFTLEQAIELRTIIRQSGKVFALTHNYTGYPMVKQARQMVRHGELGRILKVVVEYPQGYAIGSVEGDAAISNWRADPAVAGTSNCIGDIGTHAENLARYITGLDIESLCAELTAFIPGRQLDDDGNMLLRFKGGARGILFASQVSSGDENNLNIRIWGTKGSLQWFQEHPNELIWKSANEPQKIYRRGNSYLCEAARQSSRLPFGHQEAFIEAFANVYLSAFDAIEDAITGRPAREYDFPDADDGVYGMAFVRAAVESSQKGAVWVPFPEI